MHRVLVVDDEPHVVHGLKDLLLDCRDLELDVYTALDGMDAHDYMLNTSFDLLITDVMMPRLSGMDLLHKVKSYWPNCRVILFTGHGNFDDLYAANKYQHVTYLLKNIADEELLAIVKEILNEMEQQDNYNSISEKIKKLAPEALLVMQQNFFAKLLQSKIDNPDTIREQFVELDIPLSAENKLLLAIGRCSFSEVPDLPWALLSLVRERAPVEIQVTIAMINQLEESFTLLFQFQEEQSKWHNAQFPGRIIMNLLDPLPKWSGVSVDTNMMIIISDHLVSWMELHEKYEKIRLLAKSTRMESGCIISEGMMEQRLLDNLKNNQFSFDYSLFPKLSLKLESRDQEGVVNIIKSILDQAKNGDTLHLQSKMEIYTGLHYFIANYISKHGLDFLQIMIRNFPLIISEMVDISEEKILNIYSSMIKKIITAESEIQSPVQSKAVTLVCSYIDSNLEKDLSLVRLADLVFLNPSYLARLFKKIQGTTVLEYTNIKKIERVKYLLQQTNMQMQDITRAVGFSSANYFSRFVKKYTGKAPQQLRTDYLLS